MSYLETVQQKRTVGAAEKAHRELLAAIEDLKTSLLAHTPLFTAQKTAKEDKTHAVALRKVLEQGIDRIYAALSERSEHDNLLKAIKALKIEPSITVEAPDVTVEAPDLDFAPLQAAIFEAVAPLGGVTDRFDLSRYRAVDLKDGENVQYVGFLNPEGDWYIIENKVRENSMRFVFGSGAYTTRFRKCASYVYKQLDKAIHDAV